jgi:SAM-dependent methyltransferase
VPEPSPISSWQERITNETPPAIRAEHELRYRIAAPLLSDAGTWVDLGCGNGLAAAAAFGERRPGRAVLVDLDEQAVARAARELAIAEVERIAGDLTDSDLLDRIGTAALGQGGEVVVSCFEVVEHLSTFLPLLEWSLELAREHGVTFVLSVPNDEFWAIENPHHQTSWSEGAFEELRGLLPPEQTLLRQVALTGSALIGWDGAVARYQPTVEAGGETAVATHFIAAFGPRHRDVRPDGALAVQADQLEQRRWERQRESNVALAQQIAREQREVIEAQEARVIEQREELRANTATFEQWRVYIHELERELGRPLAGSAEAIAAAAGEAPAAAEMHVDGRDREGPA